jgi:hypothetical protein
LVGFHGYLESAEDSLTGSVEKVVDLTGIEPVTS